MPEVEHLHERRAVRALRHEEVRGLEVAMDHALHVRLGQRLHRLEQVVDGDEHRAARLGARHSAIEVGAVEELHHDVRRAVQERAHIEDAYRMLALDLARGLRLTLEAEG